MQKQVKPISWLTSYQHDDRSIHIELNSLTKPCKIIFDYPFCSASDIQLDILLRPSQGSFLRDFSGSSKLHAGIKINDRLMHYDHDGLHILDPGHSEDWNQCIALNFITKIIDEDEEFPISDRSVAIFWLEAMELILEERNGKWSKSEYDSDSKNCFDFTIEFARIFLKQLSSNSRTKLDSSHKQSLNSRVDFCEHFIYPLTERAARYLSIYRKLKPEELT